MNGITTRLFTALISIGFAAFIGAPVFAVVLRKSKGVAS